MNGWSLGESRLNEENNVPIWAWIVTTDTWDKKKEVGVQRTWTKGKDKEIALA
jgi:hypothetical protein